MDNNKILIVDDDKDLLYTIATLLEAHDYEVYLATNVNSAVRIAQRRMVDLIVLDLGLPDGGGHNVIERLNATEPHKKYRLIVLYESVNGRQEARPRIAGARRCFQKPVDAGQLLDAVQAVLPPHTDPVMQS